MKNGVSFLLLLLLVIPACRDEGADTPGSPVTPGLAIEQNALSSAESGLDINPKTKPDVPTLEERVIQNCYLVRDAANAWGGESGGTYPATLHEESPLGNTLLDFLPNGEALVNPFTGERTEPRNGGAGLKGQTGYTGYLVGGEPVAFVITGCGSEDGVMILTIIKDPRLEEDEGDEKVATRIQKM